MAAAGQCRPAGLAKCQARSRTVLMHNSCQPNPLSDEPIAGVHSAGIGYGPEELGMSAAVPFWSQSRFEPWVEALLRMVYNNPRHRPLLDMEGLKRWVSPQLDGYRVLFEAVDDLHFFN